ncbi:MAG: hypothetical protein ACRCT8_04175 [Lacipirellulaceae bacterium]
MLDWRTYVRSYPLYSLGAAVVVGLLVAPRSARGLRISDKQLRRIADAGGLTVVTRPQPPDGASTIFSMITSAAARSALNLVSSRLLDQQAQGVRGEGSLSRQSDNTSSTTTEAH